jgi:hypothetical protein
LRLGAAADREDGASLRRLYALGKLDEWRHAVTPQRNPFVLQLVLAYLALSAILFLGFDIDIISWWTAPVYELLQAAHRRIMEWFQ